MADNFARHESDLVSPASNFFDITPHDSNELAYFTRGIYVGIGGDVVLTSVNDETVTFVGVAGGSVLPVRAKILKSTGTTATNIIGLY